MTLLCIPLKNTNRYFVRKLTITIHYVSLDDY